MTTKLFVSALTLALLSSATPVFAGSTVTPDSVVTNVVAAPTATQLVEKFGDKLDQYITALASKAGVAADHFYPIFVKQQRITGIFELFLMALGAVVGISLLCLAFRNIEGSSNDLEQSKCILGFIGGTVFTVITAITLMVQGADSVSKVFNPEYHAVQILVQMVK